MNKRQYQRLVGRADQGFSIVELLIVIAIIAILATIGVSGFSFIDSMRLKSSAQTVQNELSLARQYAIKSSQRVEVRVYQVPLSGGSGTAAWRALRSYVPNVNDTKLTAIDKPSYLADGYVIAPNAALSSALQVPPTNPAPPLDSQFPTQTYVRIVFDPDGGVDTASSSGTITVLKTIYANNSTLPINYVLLQIISLTGQSITYQP